MPDQHVTVAVTGAAGQIGYALVFRIASGQVFGPEPASGCACWSSRRPSHRLRAWPWSWRTAPSRSCVGGDHLERGRGVPRRQLGPARRRRPPQGGHGAQGPARHQRRDLLGAGSVDRGQRRRGRAGPGRGQSVQHELPDRVAGGAGHPAGPMVRDDHARRDTGPGARSPRRRDRGRGSRPRHLGQPLLDPVPRCVPRHDRRPGRGRGHQRRRVAARRVHHHRPAARGGDHRGPRLVVRGLRRQRGDRDGPQRRRPTGQIFSAAVPSPGEEGGYGVPEGPVFGFPLRGTGPGQVEIVQGISHDAWAAERIAATLAELIEERDAVGELVA